MATSPPWQDTDWKSEVDYLDGYPFPITSQKVEQFDITHVYSIWIQDGYTNNYYHPKNNDIEIFDVTKLYSVWDLTNTNKLYGYVSPKGPNIYRIGAFANTPNLSSIYIPTTVTYIGRFSFSESGIENVTIAPDCKYFDTTFPETCTINYFPVTNFQLVSQPSKLTYYVGETFDPSGLVVSATISGNNELSTRVINNDYSISGYDTSITGEQVVTVTYQNQTTSFEITVIPYPTINGMEYSWEQGSGTDSTGELDVESTTRIRCQEYFDINQASKIKIEALSSQTQLVSYVYFYDSDKTFISALSGSLSYGTIQQVVTNTAYIRIILGYSDDSEITPSDLTDCAIILVMT